MNLYEYNDIIDTLLNTESDGVDEETGVVYDLTLLDRLEMERNEKIENILLYAAQLNTDAKNISEYVAKLNSRAKAKKAKAERLTEWLISEITRYGSKKFETQKIKAIVRVGVKTNILDESKLPEQYIRVKTETSADKNAILAALKAGEVIDGAELIESKTLQIK